MVEIFLIASNLLFAVSIIVYFFLKEFRQLAADDDRIDKLDLYYTENLSQLQTFFKEQFVILKDLSKSKDDLFQKTLIEYLKHNERLEKMILPQPVTKKAVEEVLANLPEQIPNDIEKSDKELEQDELNDLLSRTPITATTKVAFEDDGSGLISGGLSEEILPATT